MLAVVTAGVDDVVVGGDSEAGDDSGADFLGAGADSFVGAESEDDFGAEVESEADFEAEVEFESDFGAEVEFESDFVTEFESDLGAEVESDADFGAGVELESDIEEAGFTSVDFFTSSAVAEPFSVGLLKGFSGSSLLIFTFSIPLTISFSFFSSLTTSSLVFGGLSLHMSLDS